MTREKFIHRSAIVSFIFLVVFVSSKFILKEENADVKLIHRYSCRSIIEIFNRNSMFDLLLASFFFLYQYIHAYIYKDTIISWCWDRKSKVTINSFYCIGIYLVSVIGPFSQREKRKKHRRENGLGLTFFFFFFFAFLKAISCQNSIFVTLPAAHGIHVIDINFVHCYTM